MTTLVAKMHFWYGKDAMRKILETHPELRVTESKWDSTILYVDMKEEATCDAPTATA